MTRIYNIIFTFLFISAFCFGDYSHAESAPTLNLHDDGGYGVSINDEHCFGYHVPEHYRNSNIGGALHRVSFKGQQGEFIALGDNSLWSVYLYDQKFVRWWEVNEPIVIAPHRESLCDPFSRSYQFEMYNQARDELIRVNLSQIPENYIPKYYITHVDSNHLIHLSDGSAWEVSVYDRHCLDHYKLGDYVLFGLNNDRSTLPCNCILINIQANHYVRVIRIY